MVVKKIINDSRRKYGYVRYILSILLLILFIYLLLYKIDFIKIKKLFISANWFFIGISFIFPLLSNIIKTFRWQVILKVVKKISFSNLFCGLGISQMITSLFPFRVGDVFQVVYLNKREGISKTDVISSMLVYQVIDFFSFFFVYIIISFFVIFPIEFRKAIFISCGLFSLIFLLYLIFRRNLEFVIFKFSKFLGAKFSSLNDMMEIFSNIKLFSLIMSLTVVLWFLGILQVFFIFKGFGISLSLLMVLAYISVPNLVTIVPSTPGFIGVWEYVAVNVLYLFGIEKEVALSCTMVHRFVGLSMVGILGLFCFAKEGFNIKILRE